MTHHRVRTAVLDASGCQAVHDAAVEVLEKTGVEVQHDGALSLLAKAGARVDGTRVRIPGVMVDEALQAAPRSIPLTIWPFRPACSPPWSKASTNPAAPRARG